MLSLDHTVIVLLDVSDIHLERSGSVVECLTRCHGLELSIQPLSHCAPYVLFLNEIFKCEYAFFYFENKVTFYSVLLFSPISLFNALYIVSCLFYITSPNPYDETCILTLNYFTTPDF